MSDTRWSRLRELFDQVREMSGEERRAELDRELAGEPDLRRDLDALLQANDTAAGFLAERPAPAAGTIVGPYRLIEKIGEGGFGVVYLAEQLRPIRRRVALKLIRPGMDSKQVIARFEAERQALALMDHPGIAQVFDAGETEQGRPYFVMEHVPGVPITSYADAERLPLRQRLGLFLQACQAIEHAHQKGVIHRDIKPSNILVTRRDGGASLKVIDFGIAKATGEVAIGRPTMTREGMIVGTAGYMSPEQLGAIPAPVDTRSDIYSLGVLLYELLAGVLPFDRERLERASWLDAMQMILTDPPTPAARAADTDTGGAAGKRSTDARTLLRALKGELEWITLRAIDKEPDRRYPSATELAADVRRYLAGEPVSAAAPGTLYRLSKYARRHRVGVTAAVLIFVAIVAGGIAAGIGFGRAVKAERAARREAESSRQVADFLAGLFHASSPGAHEDSLTVRSLLDQGVRRIESDPPADPYVRARLLGAVSDSYLNLEYFDEGIRLIREALAAVENARPRDDVAVAHYLDKLANGFSMAGRTDSIPPLVDRTIALLSAHPGGDPGLLASCFYRKARYRMDAGALDEADSLITRALATAISLPRPEPGQLCRIYSTRALLATWRFEFDEGLADYKRALECSIEAEEPMRTAGLHQSLASTFSGLGEADSALVHAQIGVDMARKLYGPDHTLLATALEGLAEALASLRRIPQAVAAQEEAVQILRAKDLYGDHLPFALAALGGIHESAGQIDQAIGCTGEAIDLYRARLGPGHFRVAEALANQARYQMEAGRPAAADTLFRGAIAILEAMDDRTILSPLARQDYGSLCLDLGRPAQAESLFARAATALDSTNAAMRPYYGDNLIARARLRARQARYAEAESLAAVGLRMLREGLADNDPQLIDPWLCLAEVRWLGGDADAAMKDLDRAVRSGATVEDARRYPGLVALRGRPGYPFDSSP